jgi:hypothetical protein
MLIRDIVIPFIKKFINLNACFDAPLDSWVDSTPSPKVKTMEGKGIGVHSLVHSTLGVEGHVGARG